MILPFFPICRQTLISKAAQNGWLDPQLHLATSDFCFEFRFHMFHPSQYTGMAAVLLCHYSLGGKEDASSVLLFTKLVHPSRSLTRGGFTVSHGPKKGSELYIYC